LSELEETIALVRDKIRKFRDIYSGSEEAVRYQIVNPVLRALGWNFEDPEFVMPNVTTEEGAPDYTLLKNGKQVMFVEAKNLSTDIESKLVVQQLAKYCFGRGVKYGLLTNGAQWTLFWAFKEDTTMPERAIWKVDVENEDIHSVARHLDTIARDNVEKIEYLMKKFQSLEDTWKALVDQPKDIVIGIFPVFKRRVEEAHPEQHMEDHDIEDFIAERLEALISPNEEPAISPADQSGSDTILPRQLRRMTIGGATFDVKNSYDILVNTAEWLIKQGKLKRADCPVVIGPKRNLVNTEPKHRYGDPFTAAVKLSNGLYLEKNYSTAGCITNSRKLLEKFGFEANLLVVTGRT